MIIYTCPKCGGDIYHNYISPIDIWACLDCDWKYEVPDKLEYRPFEQIKIKSDEDWTLYEALDNVIVNG